jgi:uncharacterized membrane protein
MKIKNFLGLTVCMALLAGILLGCIVSPVNAMTDISNKQSTTMLNAQETASPLILSTKYPVLSGPATTEFTFDVALEYFGKESKLFDLKLTGPDNYFYTLRQTYGGDSDIASIKLDPIRGSAETLRVKATPNILNLPNPGEYIITLEASSGDITESIDLKVIVTARYGLLLDTTGGILSTQITANKDNFFTINLRNTGTAVLEDINITTSVRGSPSNWEVTVEPNEIDSLDAKAEKELKLNIRPPAKTISGDYEITVNAKTEKLNASDDVTIRVTVLTQTIWGWVGVGIVVIVVAGLIAMFMFMGRR